MFYSGIAAFLLLPCGFTSLLGFCILTHHFTAVHCPLSAQAAPKWVSMPVCSAVSDYFIIPWTAAHQAPLFLGFPREEHWSGLPFPPSGDLPDPGIEPASPASTGGFFNISATWEDPLNSYYLPASVLGGGNIILPETYKNSLSS